MSKYRDWILNNTVVAETEDVTNETEFVPKTEVEDFLNEVETRVNEFLSALDPIKGLTEIDDLKGFVIKFAGDLC